MTPTAGSNFSRYVIPSDLTPEGICCIHVPVPDDPEWVAQFMGALWRMSLQTHYERDAGHSGKVVASRWRQIWTEVQAMPCCDPTGTSTIQNIYNNQINTQIYLNSLRQLYIDAALDVSVAFLNVPVNFNTDPGDAGAEIDDRERALCLACESYVRELFNQGVAWIEGIAPEIAAVAIGAMTLPSVPTWLVGAALTTAGLSLGTVHNQLTHEPYRDYIACGMYDALKGQSTGLRSAFATSLDSLPVRPPPPQTTAQGIARDIIEVWARGQVNNLDDYLSFVNGLDRAFTIANIYSDEDCACLDPEWCFEIDFTVTDGGFVDTGICSDFGTWVDGVGWVSETSGPSQSICIHRSFPDAIFTHAEQTVTTDEVLSGPGSGRAIQGRLLTVPQFTEIGSQDNGTFTTVWDGTETLDQMLLNPSGQGPSVGGIVLTHALFRGTGSNPFGFSNC